MSESFVGVGAKFSPLTKSDVSESVKSLLERLIMYFRSFVCWYVGGLWVGALDCLVSWWGVRRGVSLFVLLVVVVGLFIVLYEIGRLIGMVRRFKKRITGCRRVWVWLRWGC